MVETMDTHHTAELIEVFSQHLLFGLHLSLGHAVEHVKKKVGRVFWVGIEEIQFH